MVLLFASTAILIFEQAIFRFMILKAMVIIRAYSSMFECKGIFVKEHKMRIGVNERSVILTNVAL